MLPIKSILIVDDDPVEVFLNKSDLEKLTSLDKVVTASNISEALQLYNTEFLSNKTYPELILLDLNLSFEEGWYFIEFLLKMDPTALNKTKLFILTNSTREKDIKKAKEYNVSGYIEKPFSLQKLIAAMTCEQFILVV